VKQKLLRAGRIANRTHRLEKQHANCEVWSGSCCNRCKHSSCYIGKLHLIILLQKLR